MKNSSLTIVASWMLWLLVLTSMNSSVIHHGNFMVFALDKEETREKVFEKSSESKTPQQRLDKEEEQDCVVQEDGTVLCTSKTVKTSEKKQDDAGAVVQDKASTEISDCQDNHELCSFWASGGECTINPRYMLQNCKKSCNNCIDTQLELKLSSEERRRMEEQTLLELVKNYGEPQKAEGKEKSQTLLVVRKTIDYMRNFIHAENPTHRISREILEQCTNSHELCSFWAAIGECENNISFMQTKCAPSCQSCAKIDFDTRCPQRPKDEVPALLPGKLHQMFERIVGTAPGNRTDETMIFAQERRVQEDGMPFYTVTVHSKPQQSRQLETSAEEKDVNEAPWVITFENFLTDEECDHLIQLGHKAGYDRSKDVGERTLDGSYSAKISSTRTSENAWCSVKNGCRDDPIAARVRERISSVLQIPSENFEDFQLLKYEEGQFYVSHHDYIPHQRDRACGPRILTFYLYLSDVEEGGGTKLDQINGGLVIEPKKGRALLWPSVLDHDPSKKDGRTTHQALPVEKGTKYGANTWVHLYNVIETQKRGCT